jgi:hypothetical protein
MRGAGARVSAGDAGTTAGGGSASGRAAGTSVFGGTAAGTSVRADSTGDAMARIFEGGGETCGAATTAFDVSDDGTGGAAATLGAAATGGVTGDG